MKLAIVGTGYVGLVSGACFAEFGAEVTCVDKDEARIAALKAGNIPIYQPGLEELVSRNVDTGHLSFTTSLAEPISDADLVFIAVGTPTRQDDDYADLQHVYSATAEIAGYLKGYTVIVEKSTVPVGTARVIQRIIGQTNPVADFDVASNPEFLRAGSAISDFMHPDRVVIGVESEKAEALLRELYRPLNLIEVPMVVTDLESAELIKYASNAFLATKISFINEMSQLCEKTGADVHAVSRGMGLDGRIGKKFLHPGPGYGGSCLPKDTGALIRMAHDHGVTSQIMESVVEVNASQKARMITKIRNALGGSEEGKTIAVLGLTFKPLTNDMRDAPALVILPALVNQGADIKAHDPEGMEEARPLLPPSIKFMESLETTIADADAIVLMTEWNQYCGLDLDKVKSMMRGNIFIDLRNVYEPANMEKKGFNYCCVGRHSQAE